MRVRLLSESQVYIHAKVICVDCVGDAGTVFLGSENFSTSSLSYNRELGVITTSGAAVGAVRRAFDADFAAGTPLHAPSTAPVTSSGGGHHHVDREFRPSRELRDAERPRVTS